MAKKSEKQLAREAFARAIAKTDAETLIEATNQYKIRCDNDPSVWMPAHEWLDGEYWKREFN